MKSKLQRVMRDGPCGLDLVSPLSQYSAGKKSGQRSHTRSGLQW